MPSWREAGVLISLLLLGLLLAPAPLSGAEMMPAKPVDQPGRIADVSLSRSRPRSPYARMPKELYTVERQGQGVYYHKGIVRGMGVHVVDADLSDPEVRIAVMVAQGGLGKIESFHKMVRRARPAAAITGTFFGIRNRLPTGDIVVNGRHIFAGFVGTAVAITEGNVVSFIETRYKGEKLDWSLFDTVIRGGPWLVKAGKLAMAPRHEGFRTLSVSSKRRRTAIALTADNHLLFIATRQNVSLWDFAKVVRALGVHHSVALDGGSSTALYFAGRHIANPGRGLTNLLLLYHRRDRYEASRQQFAGSKALPQMRERTALPSLERTKAALPQGNFQPAQGLDLPVRRADD